MFRSVLEAGIGLAAAAAFAYFPLLGYYSVACSQDGASWAFVSLLFLPLAIPPLGLLVLVAGIAAGVTGRPLQAETAFWSKAKWLLVAAPLAGGVAWAVAAATDAHARCSFGF